MDSAFAVYPHVLTVVIFQCGIVMVTVYLVTIVRCDTRILLNLLCENMLYLFKHYLSVFKSKVHCKLHPVEISLTLVCIHREKRQIIL